MVVFKGMVPRPLPVPPRDLNGDRVTDISPKPRDFTQLSSYGAIKSGKDQLPFVAAPRSILTSQPLPPFRDAAHYIACHDPNALFYPPNTKSLLSFTTGMRVALMSSDGKLHFPMTISSFVVGLRARDFIPVLDGAGRVVVQAIEADGETIKTQILLQDLVWVTPSGERVNPDWVLSPPKKIPQTPSEILLKPLFEEVQAMPRGSSPQDKLRMIDTAITRWAGVDEDPARTQQLMASPMREALKRALGLLSGLAPKDF